MNRLRAIIVSLPVLTGLSMSQGTAQEIISSEPTHINLSGMMSHDLLYFTGDSSSSSVRLLFNMYGGGSGDFTTTNGDQGPEYVSWTHEVVALGISADIPLGEAFALTLGGEFGPVEGESNFAASIGIGWCLRLSPIALRFDFNAQVRTMKYDVDYLTSRYLILFVLPILTGQTSGHQAGTGTAFTPRLTLTLNTTSSEALCNPVLGLGFAVPGLFKFDTPDDTQVTESARMASVTPGLSFQMASGSRLMAGVRFLWLKGAGEAEGVTITGMIQMEFAL